MGLAGLRRGDGPGRPPEPPHDSFLPPESLFREDRPRCVCAPRLFRFSIFTECNTRRLWFCFRERDLVNTQCFHLRPPPFVRRSFFFLFFNFVQSVHPPHWSVCVVTKSRGRVYAKLKTPPRKHRAGEAGVAGVTRHRALRVCLLLVGNGTSRTVL